MCLHLDTVGSDLSSLDRLSATASRRALCSQARSPPLECNIGLQGPDPQIHAMANLCSFDSGVFFAAAGKATLMQEKNPNDGMTT